MLDVIAIRDHGWCQGAAFQEDDHRRLAEMLSVDVEPNSRLLVVSQDCDIVHPNLEAEPFVEILFARLLNGTPDGSFAHGKNPRRLHVPINIGGSSQYYECVAHERYQVDRRTLAELSPDPECHVDEPTLHLIRSWIAARYTRTAFPDAFNIRVADALRGQARMLKSRGRYLSGIYVAVTPWRELGEDDVYRIELYAAMEAETWAETATRQEMFSLIDDIALALNNCDGIDVENYELRSENEISLADLRFLRRWDYDYLSYRESPDGVLPAQQ